MHKELRLTSRSIALHSHADSPRSPARHLRVTKAREHARAGHEGNSSAALPWLLPTYLRAGLTIAAVLVLLIGTTDTHAADIVKSNNTTDLNDSNSWVGGVVPTSSDIAVWSNNVTGANNPSPGANLSFGGLRIVNPGGMVTIGGGYTLTLGSSGVDMSAATQNLTINSRVSLDADQTWTIAAGRTLQISASSAVFTNTYSLAIAGAGGTFDWRSQTNTTLSGNITVDRLFINRDVADLELTSTDNSFETCAFSLGDCVLRVLAILARRVPPAQGALTRPLSWARALTTAFLNTRATPFPSIAPLRAMRVPPRLASAWPRLAKP